MGFRFRRNFKAHETRTPIVIRGSGVSYTERTPIRQGRTRTGGLLDAVIYVGLLLVGIALFV